MRRVLLLVLMAVLFAVVGILLFIDGKEELSLGGDTQPGAALAGEPWDGQGKRGISEGRARAFNAFDLYWLGPTYGGLHLQAILDIPQSGEATLIYGTCRVRGGGGFEGGSCPIPLSVDIRSACFVRPEQARGAYQGQDETLRGGALALKRSIIGPGGRGGDQSALIWTGQVVVNIQANGLPMGQIDAILNDLVKFNDGGGQPGGPLPPPDFSRCS